MMEEIKQAIAEYEENMETAFSEWHKARAGEELADRLKEIISLINSGNNVIN